MSKLLDRSGYKAVTGDEIPAVTVAVLGRAATRGCLTLIELPAAGTSCNPMPTEASGSPCALYFMSGVTYLQSNHA